MNHLMSSMAQIKPPTTATISMKTVNEVEKKKSVKIILKLNMKLNSNNNATKAHKTEGICTQNVRQIFICIIKCFSL